MLCDVMLFEKQVYINSIDSMARLRNRFATLAIVIMGSVLMSVVWINKEPRNTVFYSGPEAMLADQSDHFNGPRTPFPNVTKIVQKAKYLLFQWPHSLERFDCAKLFNNDDTEIQRARQYLTQNNYTFSKINNLDFSRITSNCDNYKLSRQFINDMNDEESKFPIAFNILFYNNVEQLERLLRTLYRPRNHYCIHIDAKTPQSVIESVRNLASCFNNVFLASKSETIIYKSFSRLIADINCMRDHVDRSRDWKYLINMASSELPIMSNLQIVKILKLFNQSNNMREVMVQDYGQRYSKRHITHIDAVSKTGYIEHTNVSKDDPPYGLTIVKGNAYNIYSRAFVQFALEDSRARALLSWSADTLTPDEHYWATLNSLYNNPFLNTPGGNKAHPNRTSYFGRYIGWRDSIDTASRCKAGRYVHSICIFSIEDISVIKSRKEIIANKFDLDYDPVAYTCMEEWLFNKTRDNEGLSPLNVRLYRKVSKSSSNK